MGTIFTNGIDLEQSAIINALMHPVVGDVATPVEGQLWYNSTTETLRLRLSASTVSLAAGAGIASIVEDVTPQLGGPLDLNGEQITADGTREMITFVVDGAAVNHIQIENEATGSGPIIRSTGDDTDVDLNFDTKGSGDFNFSGDIAVTGTVDGRDVAADGSTIDNDVVLKAAGSTAGFSFVIDEDSFATDTATQVPTQQSVKAYVASQVAGFSRYVGGYNASTNSPDLDSSPVAGIKQGDQYTVTAAGAFFTANVEIGDLLIAENDAPTTEAEWTIVNRNLEDGVSRKYTELIGDGVATVIAVTHNLGTKDVSAISLRRVSDDALVIPDAVATSANVVTYTFQTAPATDAFSAIIIG